MISFFQIAFPMEEAKDGEDAAQHENERDIDNEQVFYDYENDDENMTKAEIQAKFMMRQQ